MYRLFLLTPFMALVSCNNSGIIIEDGFYSDGQESFRILTSTATYVYQKIPEPFPLYWTQMVLIGFSSMILAMLLFRNHHPRIRGLPNLIFQSENGSCGHPGFDKMKSEILSANQIRSTLLSEKWQWTGTFH